MKYIVTVNNKKYEVEVEEAAASSSINETAADKAEQKVTEAVKKPAPSSNVTGKEIVKAPMPGTILDIKVTNGQAVKKGDVLFILEAMKMENEIMSGVDGTVKDISVSKGDSVNTGDLLLVLK